MRLGIISDIHGNLPALEAVFGAMPPIDLLLCAGDVVGYYPDVNEVCERIRQSGASVVRGNHDAYVTGALTPAPAKVAAYRTDWTRETLTSENRAWLKTLPAELRLSFGSARVILRHASPWDEESYLYPDSPQVGRVELHAGAFLVLGHTHIPLKRSAGGGVLINPGSVGQPRDGDPRAACCVLDTTTGEVEFVRCSYDVRSYQEQLRTLGWNEKMIQILSRKKRPI